MAHARLIGAGALSAGLFVAATASAYCRTTTCDLETATPLAECTDNTTNGDGCSTAGHVLQWPGGCVFYGVQQDGSKLRGIDHDELHGAVQRAFETWGAADCGGGSHPSFAVTDTDSLYGPVVCPEHEFSVKHPNASAWMFDDASWPYLNQGEAIALTSASADVKTGDIYDADVEINSHDEQITVGDAGVIADLDSIVTHEAGHYLGLAHSLVREATMYRGYDRASTTSRTLHPDDVAAICAAYPPENGEPTCGEPSPLFGFSRYCGGVNPSTLPEQRITPKSDGSCSVTLARPGATEMPLSLAFLSLGVLRRRRPRAR